MLARWIYDIAKQRDSLFFPDMLPRNHINILVHEQYTIVLIYVMVFEQYLMGTLASTSKIRGKVARK
jgi:hypothetical protein